VIGIRYDALTDRWVVLVLPTLERDPEIPIAWKQTEEDARAFGQMYAPNGLVDLDREAEAKGPPDARRAIIQAIQLALQELDRPALIAVAMYASRLLPTERPPAAPAELDTPATSPLWEAEAIADAKLDAAAEELDAPDRWVEVAKEGT
jgi:hypothetical protein